MSYNFFAMYSRMKYINRWALMRNTREENLSEHCADVAAISHALAVIKNKHFGGSVNAERAALLGLYHDMPEIITGDMPTPVKYFSKTLRSEFAEYETLASKKLLSMLPDELKGEYEPLFFKEEKDEYLWKIVKAADKISALVKCIRELSVGNMEFSRAFESTKEAIEKLQLPEADFFVEQFIESFKLSLDELSD